MAPSRPKISRRIGVRWLVAGLVMVGAALPLVFVGVTEVQSLRGLRDHIAGQTRQAAETLARESANALQLHTIKSISQTLSDKAAGVNDFFQDVRTLVTLQRDIACQAWDSPARTTPSPLIDADAMRSKGRRPKDASLDPVRGCVVSFAAPLMQAPKGTPAAAVAAAKGQFAKVAFSIRSILEQNRELILFTYMATPDGMFMSYPADTGLSPDYDPRSRDWYRAAARAKAAIWTSPYQDAGTGVLVMTCAAPMFAGDKAIGVIGLDVRLDPFMREVLALRSEPQADAALMDSKGAFVVPPRAGRARSATPADVYGQEAVDRILAGKYDMFDFTFDSVQRFAGAKHIPTVGWHMVVTMPKEVTLVLSRKIQGKVETAAEKIDESIKAGVQGATQRLGGMAFVLAALVVALSVVIGAVLSRPVRTLARMADRVARGEFGARAPSMVTRELDELAASFNHMAAEIAERTERVTREAAERERILTELSAANEIQSSFLPHTFPTMAGAQMHALWEPARETAGDFYDCFELPDGRVGLVVADVSGKGLGAAVFMASALSLMRTHAREAAAPDEVLRRTNMGLLSETDASMFVTAVYAIYTPATGRLEVSDAGHTWPLASFPNGCQELEFAGGVPLGVTETDFYQTTCFDLRPGDSFVCYTDGITEAFDSKGDAFGVDRMMEVYQRVHQDAPDKICLEILAAVQAWSAGRSQSDDICILALARDRA